MSGHHHESPKSHAEPAKTEPEPAKPEASAGVDWRAMAEVNVNALESSFGNDAQLWGEWLGRQNPHMLPHVMLLMNQRKGMLFGQQVLRYQTPAKKLPDSRPLNQDEIDYVSPIYLNTINYKKVRLVFGDSDYARVLGNTIHMPESSRDLQGKLVLGKKDEGMELFAHEIGHVWQFQNAGPMYAPDAVIAQLREELGGRKAYDWKAYVAEKRPFETWNPEAQAEVGAAYNIAMRRLQAVKPPDRPNLEDIQTVQLAAPYIGHLMSGHARRSNSETKDVLKVAAGPIGGAIIDHLVD